LARQHGRTLVAAVDRVLEEEMKELEPTIAFAYREVDLGLNRPPTRAELVEYRDSIARGYQKQWAERILSKMEKGDEFPDSHPFPLQVWMLGDQPLFTLGGETVVGYAIQLKKIFGHDIFVMGYSNDVVSYIPTAVILHEGGYEGCIAQQVYGLAGTWAYDIESVIVSNMVELARGIGVPIPDNRLIRIKKR
jgi:neutral ceramidase